MADATQNVTLTVNGTTITAPKGTLLIEACKQNGIEIPAFCYYPGLSLQGACRMCLVEIEKMPKMQTACTTPVAEGMVVQTESEKVVQARKSTLEMLLANHPLDCPVCDAGGECELQDMTFKYGAGESKFIDIKSHRDEQQWSPIVFYDRPRCILCYRCVRVCGEGMDVWALGIQNRGQGSVIAPNQGDSLDCEECGMCIDICPGRRTHQRFLPLQDAPLGDDPRWHRLQPLRRRMPHYGGRAPLRNRLGDCALRQPRPQRHQRRVPLHQGTLRLRLCRQPGARHHAPDQARWKIRCSHLDAKPSNWSQPGSSRFFSPAVRNRSA